MSFNAFTLIPFPCSGNLQLQYKITTFRNSINTMLENSETKLTVSGSPLNRRKVSGRPWLFHHLRTSRPASFSTSAGISSSIEAPLEVASECNMSKWSQLEPCSIFSKPMSASKNLWQRLHFFLKPVKNFFYGNTLRRIWMTCTMLLD
jgi:hypothetical protein